MLVSGPCWCQVYESNADESPRKCLPRLRLRHSPGVERGPWLPIHELCLFKLGVHLGELWYLGELARWLREHDRYRFFLTAPPLHVPGAVGSPANPIATV